ncbi:DUF2798 domain-containing protein [Paenibacillus jamilae]|uniref:DUF2798 domain-containing protein n=1 Tax=Paenibacillus jamilae TaxID=114136 RepID=UPI003D280187
MPTTKKESFYFGIMMCFGMVIIMTFYNLLINGLIGKISLLTVAVEFLVGFSIALVLDLYIVGPIAKKVALSLPFDKSKKIILVITISTCMVLGMAFSMSFYGLFTSILNHDIGDYSLFKAYLEIFMKNFVMAYPLQLLVMGPAVRAIFIKFIKKNEQVGPYKKVLN